MNYKIGIFDSGMGGFSILEELKKYYLMKHFYIIKILKIIPMEKRQKRSYLKLLRIL